MNKSIVTAETGKLEIIVERIFNAPIELVFSMYTDPEAIPKWWGPSNLTTIVEHMEARKGGTWRILQQDTDMNVFAFNGVYHDCVMPSRIVRTFEYEGSPGDVMLETVTFQALQAGGTKLIAQTVFQSLEVRDGFLRSGAEGGVIEGMERFAKLVAEAARRESSDA